MPRAGIVLVAASEPENMDGQSIIDRLAETYFNALTYVEHARIDRRHFSESFKTSFRSPGKLRYEYSDIKLWVDKPGGIYKNPPERGTSVLWSDGRNCYRKKFYKPITEQEESLSAALGISPGKCPLNGTHSAFLLNSPIADRRDGVLALADITRLSDDYFEGVDCYRLKGSLVSSKDAEVWIAKQNFTLRRLRLKSWFYMMHKLGIDEDVPDNDGLPFNHELIYESVRINEPVDDRLFDPPSNE